MIYFLQINWLQIRQGIFDDILIFYMKRINFNYWVNKKLIINYKFDISF